MKNPAFKVILLTLCFPLSIILLPEVFFASGLTVPDLINPILTESEKDFNSEEIQFQCSCNDLQLTLMPKALPGEKCCFELKYTNNNSPCFNQVSMNVVSNNLVSLTPIANSGFTFNQSSVTQLTFQHSSGNLPVGTHTIGEICFNQSISLFGIQVVYQFFDSGAIRTCTTGLEVQCPDRPPGKCDSLNPFFNLLHFFPPKCCFNYYDDILMPNCFNKITLELSSGFFTNVVTNTLQNFSDVQSGNTLSYTHLTGTMPAGQINPGSFCISGQTNPFTIKVKYYYLNNEKKDSCMTEVTTNCPEPPPDSTCMSEICPNNSIWGQVLPTTQYIIYDMAVLNNKLYVAGVFNSIANLSNANSIACWDGTNWSTLGIGPNNGVTGIIFDLLIHGGKLFIGGKFNTAGGIPCNNVIIWDDVSQTFTTLGTFPSDGVSGSLNPDVKALYSYGLDVIVGGNFTQVGGITGFNNVALWNDFNQTWSSNNFNAGLSGGTVKVFRLYNNQLIAGGAFINPVSAIAKWTGTAWMQLGNGMSLLTNPLNGVAALEEYNGKLVVGGRFAGANQVAGTMHIAVWDGNSWASIDNGANGGTEITDMLVHNNELYFSGTPNLNVGSNFINNAVGRLFNNLWASTGYSNMLVYCLESFDPPDSNTGCQIFAGGELTLNTFICSTGTKNEDEQSVRFYPNPANDILNIQTSAENFEIEIFNINGQKIPYNLDFRNCKICSLNISDLPSGCYFVQTVNRDKGISNVFRFIKINN